MEGLVGLRMVVAAKPHPGVPAGVLLMPHGTACKGTSQ